MERLDNGLVIYSITIGDNPNNAVKWSVGQVIHRGKADFTVTSIFIDESYWEHYQKESYVIIIKDKEGHEHLWRRYTEQRTSLIYDI